MGGSDGKNTASGHRRAAVQSGMPERMPNSRAAYDAVATTARSVGSPLPPTTTGFARQLRAPGDLDCGEELIQVDTQHPRPDIRPY